MDPRFSRSIIGYSPAGVSAKIRKLRSDFGREMDLRQAQEKHVVDSNEEKRLDTMRMELEITRYRERERQVLRSLAQAQADAQTIERDAQQKAEEIRQETLEQVAAERAQLAELKSLLARFKGEFDEILVKYETGLVPVLEDGQSGVVEPDETQTHVTQGDTGEAKT